QSAKRALVPPMSAKIQDASGCAGGAAPGRATPSLRVRFEPDIGPNYTSEGGRNGPTTRGEPDPGAFGRWRIFARYMFRTLRLSLRFVIPLAIALFLMALLVVPWIDSLTTRWFVRDVEIRAQLVGTSIEDAVTTPLVAGNYPEIEQRFERAIGDERLYALGLCLPDGTLAVHTDPWPSVLGCSGVTDPRAARTLSEDALHVTARPLTRDGQELGQLLIVHDMSFMQRRSADTRFWVIGLFVMAGLVIAGITVLVAQLSLRGWVAGVREMLRDETLRSPAAPPAPELAPLIGDLREMLRDIESEQRLHDDLTLHWTPHTLRKLLHEQLSGDEIIVVSNREPYIHEAGPNGPV